MVLLAGKEREVTVNVIHTRMQIHTLTLIILIDFYVWNKLFDLLNYL